MKDEHHFTKLVTYPPTVFRVLKDVGYRIEGIALGP